MYERYSTTINIIVIYISEAHAKDEWPISHTNQTNQHKTIEERIHAARQIEDSNLPLYCDSMEKNSSFEERFAAWPERAFIVESNILRYISQHAVDGIDDWHSEVMNYLQTRI